LLLWISELVLKTAHSAEIKIGGKDASRQAFVAGTKEKL